MTASMLLAALSAALLVAACLETLARRRWAGAWSQRGITASMSVPAAAARTTPAVLAGVAAAYAWQSWPAAAAVAATTWLAVLAGYTDLTCRKIPLEACWTVLGIGTLAGLAGFTLAGLIAAVVAFLVIGSLTLLAALVTRGGLGSGDVRLLLALTPLAWWTGAVPLLYGIVLAAILQAVVRIVLLIARRPGAMLPFAPALLAGTAIAIIVLTIVGTPDATNACTEWPVC